MGLLSWNDLVGVAVMAVAGVDLFGRLVHHRGLGGVELQTRAPSSLTGSRVIIRRRAIAVLLDTWTPYM
jgi:hypothetical protein